MNEIAFTLTAPAITENDHTGGLNKRQRSRLEWESAFLRQQQQVIRRDANGVYTDSQTDERSLATVAPEMEPFTQVSATEPPAFAALPHSISNAASPSIIAGPHFGGTVSVPVQQQLPVAAMQGYRTTVDRLPNTAPSKSPTDIPEASTAIPNGESEGVRVVVQGEAARIWIRNLDLLAGYGQTLLGVLRGHFAKSGLRVAGVILNGEVLWDERPATQADEAKTNDRLNVVF